MIDGFLAFDTDGNAFCERNRSREDSDGVHNTYGWPTATEALEAYFRFRAKFPQHRDTVRIGFTCTGMREPIVYFIVLPHGEVYRVI